MPFTAELFDGATSLRFGGRFHTHAHTLIIQILGAKAVWGFRNAANAW